MKEGQIIPQIREVNRKRYTVILEPCYPEKQTVEEQVCKLVGEYNEATDATDRYNEAAEYIDIAQVTVGLIDIEGDEVPESEVTVPINENYQKEVVGNLVDEFSDNRGSYIKAKMLIIRALKTAYCICHKEGFDFEQLLEKHQAKLERRKAEWREEA